MRIYESITRKVAKKKETLNFMSSFVYTILFQELEERFKPIKCTFSPWPFAVTSIKGITERQTTQTGQVNYIVEFKDGQTKQVNQLTLVPHSPFPPSLLTKFEKKKDPRKKFKRNQKAIG